MERNIYSFSAQIKEEFQPDEGMSKLEQLIKKAPNFDDLCIIECGPMGREVQRGADGRMFIPSEWRKRCYQFNVKAEDYRKAQEYLEKVVGVGEVLENLQYRSFPMPA